MLRRRLACSIPLLAIALTACQPDPAQSDGSRVLTSWSFRWGDSPFDADGVPEWTRDPHPWRELVPFADPPEAEGQTITWLRIALPEGPWRDPALHLGDVTNALEIWADGRRIYTGGVVRPGGRESPAGFGTHIVPLDRSLLGRAVYLRVQATDGSIPRVLRFAHVGNQSAHVQELVRTGTPILILGAFSLVLGILSAAAMLWRRHLYMLGAFAAFEIFTGAVSIGMSDLHQLLWSDLTIWFRVVVLGGLLLSCSLGLFVDVVLEGRIPWLRKLLIGGTIASVALSIGGIASLDWLQSALTMLLPLIVVLLVPTLWATASAAWEGDRDARVMLVGVALVGLFATRDLMPFIDGRHASEYQVPWGLFGLTVSFIAIMTRRFVGFYTALTQSTATLAQQYEENRRIAVRLTEGAAGLLGAVEQLRTTRTEQSAGLAAQAQALQEAQVTAEEIRVLSQNAAERAAAVRNAAREAGALARSGEVALESSRSALEEIRAEVGSLADSVSALGARMREINEVVETVRELARLSNMLALNAGIEAIRSGEHGKGFTVVAREVRSLADQSLRATQQIQAILDGIGNDVAAVVRRSESGVARVDEGMRRMQASESELRRVTRAVGETHQHVRDIAAAISQQHLGVDQITLAMRSLHEQMSDTLAHLEQTERAASSVDAVARRMAANDD